MGILEKMRLDGKTAFVTGGAQGIGKCVATALAEAGANIAIVDINPGGALEAADEIAALGVKTLAIQADVTDPADVDAMARRIKREFGRLDIAMCNAGIAFNAPAEEMSFEDWSRVINVNLTGVFLTAQAAGRLMIAQGTGGSIINTASMSAHIVNRPQPQCAYNASKAGVIMLTKSLAIEWARHHIRVNSISPGYMGTELIMNAPHLKALIEDWKKDSPYDRLGRPEELQSIVVYLAGDTSSFTSGSDFIVDGAFTCK